jgi:hypothetical protein
MNVDLPWLEISDVAQTLSLFLYFICAYIRLYLCVHIYIGYSSLPVNRNFPTEILALKWGQFLGMLSWALFGNSQLM